MLKDAFFKINGREAYVLAAISIKTIDDSFSHPWGICKRCHDEVDEIDVIECQYMDTEEKINYHTEDMRERILEAMQGRLN